ncbi:hypothetical protein D3C75_529660 [compost metagenome]
MVGFGFRLYRDRDNRLREVHGLQDNRVFFVGQGVTGNGVLQTDGSCNITCVYDADFLTAVCMHLQDTADALTLVLGGIQHVGAGVQESGIDAEEGQTAHIGVGGNLERQSGERLFVRGFTGCFCTIFQCALNVRDINRSREIVHNSIQHQLYAFILIRRTYDNREDLHFANALTQRSFDFRNRNLFAFQILHGKLFVQFGHFLNQLQTKLSYLLKILGGDFNLLDVLAQIVLIHVSHLLYQIDDADKISLSADRQLDSYSIGTKTVAHLLDNGQKVRTDDIHFVDVCDTRYSITVRLSPYGFGLGFNAFLGAEHAYCTVKNTKGTFNLNREVNVTRGVDNIDAVTLPLAGSRGRRNRNAALLLLLHPVHGGRAFVHFTDLVCTTGVEQNTFGCGSLACIDMRHNPDVTCILQGELSCHSMISFRILLLWCISYQR